MRSHQRRLGVGGAAVLASLSAAVVFAQERPGAREVQPGQNARAAASQSTDQTIADCLGIGNQEEIALATLAASKTQNPQVKQFAETLVKDHGRILSRLEPFGVRKVDLARRSQERLAAPKARTPAGEPRQRGDVATREEPAKGADARASQRTAARESGLDFMDIKRQLAQKCLALAQEQWNELKGAEADQCFVGHQIVGHEQMIALQEVLRQYASPELQAVIDESTAVNQAHLEQAKQLMEQWMPQARAERPDDAGATPRSE